MPIATHPLAAFGERTCVVTVAKPLVLVALAAACVSGSLAAAEPRGKIVVELRNAGRVTRVGAIDRWDADGNPRRAVDPRAKIESPAVAAWAEPGPAGAEGVAVWEFPPLPAGRYDLVLFAGPRTRIEGFHYPPVLEFDAFWGHDRVPAAEDQEAIRQRIRAGKYFENKVRPLAMVGDSEHVRVFVELLRDEPTSFDQEAGEPIAILRHEIWEYTFQFGDWAREKRVRLLDRILLPKRELQAWTWVFAPQLGNVELKEGAMVVRA